MADARERIEEWRREYNKDGSHTALGGLTRRAYAAQANQAESLHGPRTTNGVKTNFTIRIMFLASMPARAAHRARRVQVRDPHGAVSSLDRRVGQSGPRKATTKLDRERRHGPCGASGRGHGFEARSFARCNGSARDGGVGRGGPAMTRPPSTARPSLPDASGACRNASLAT